MFAERRPPLSLGAWARSPRQLQDILRDDRECVVRARSAEALDNVVPGLHLLQRLTDDATDQPERAPEEVWIASSEFSPVGAALVRIIAAGLRILVVSRPGIAVRLIVERDREA